MLWGGSGEYRPSMDAMTYGSLAKHILSSGDWMRLHYSHQAYADFFQHPPLAIWMTAVVFKWLGASDLTSKILPNLFAWFCVLGVYLWGLRWRNAWWGFIASLVLLTSIRFTKYSVGFLLDPFLAAGMIWSVFLAQVSVAGDSKQTVRGRMGLMPSWGIFVQRPTRTGGVTYCCFDLVYGVDGSQKFASQRGLVGCIFHRSSDARRSLDDVGRWG